MVKEFPRRMRLDLNTPAELAIHSAMQEVEKIGADLRLTNAVIHLSKAKDFVRQSGQKYLVTKKTLYITA